MVNNNNNTTFDWCDYYNLAKELNENEDLTEAKLRVIISKSYYCAFCLSRNFLRDKMNDPDLQDKYGKNRNGKFFNSHKHVGEQFSNDPNNPIWHDIGKSLRTLRTNRNSADYHDEFEGKLEFESEMSLKLSKDIYNYLKQLY